MLEVWLFLSPSVWMLAGRLLRARIDPLVLFELRPLETLNALGRLDPTIGMEADVDSALIG